MARRRRRFLAGVINLPTEERIQFDAALAWKARHRRTRHSIKEKDIIIRCMGRMHKIKMRFPGRISLLHHPDLKGELTMMKLGGDKPECLKFLEQWKTVPNSAAYNRDGVQQFLQARHDWAQAKAANSNQYTDWLQFSLHKRLVARIDRIYNALRKSIDAAYTAKTKDDQVWNSWNRRYYRQEEEPEQIMRPIVHLGFRDLINPKPGGQDESD